MRQTVQTGVKVEVLMRFSNPLLLASFGVLFVAASCTLITDVDRSKIPDGVAGTPTSNGGDPNTSQAGESNGGNGATSGKGGTAGSGGTGGTNTSMAGAGGS